MDGFESNAMPMTLKSAGLHPTGKEQNEHYCTLFNLDFLPQGLVLYESLRGKSPEAVLWILCMDMEVEQALRKLDLASVRLIPLVEVEDAFPRLLEIKSSRKVVEYCWTLTPFLPQMVFDLQSDILRVTYVDSDLYFLSSPRPIFDELDASGKSVLLTEHDYGRDRDTTKACGRFCVQFMPFRNDVDSRSLLKVWQNQCLEWCYDRLEPGKFGDQLYLDVWPDLFEKSVHVMQDNRLAMGPWNDQAKKIEHAVFYHMSTFRVWNNGDVRYYTGFGISEQIFQAVHLSYEREFVRALGSLAISKIEHRLPLIPREWVYLRRRLKNSVLQKEKWGRIELDHLLNGLKVVKVPVTSDSPRGAFEIAFGTRHRIDSSLAR